MTLTHISILSILQGIGEFLPISSSAQMIVASHFLGWGDEGILVDIALHFGTLFALTLYFWRDILTMIQGVFSLALRGRRHAGATLFGFLVLGTLPLILMTLLGDKFIPQDARALQWIGWTSIIAGAIMGLADRMGGVRLGMHQLTWWRALFVGCVQVLALMPGASRSGVTMTATRLLGMRREDAAHFSFLLGLPALFGGFVFHVLHAESVHAFLETPLLMGIAISACVGLAAISFMMRWLKHGTLMPFVIYRIGLGTFLVVYATYILPGVLPLS